MQEILELKDALRKLQKSVYTLNTVLREITTITQSLELLERSYESIRRVTSDNTGLEKVLEEFVEDSDILPVIKEMRARYEYLADVFRKYSYLIEGVDATFERYRKYRYYIFRDDEDMISFVESVVDEDGEYILRPLLLEKVDLSPLEKVGKRTSKFSVTVRGSDIRRALEIMLSKMESSGFYVEGSGVKLTWKPESGALRVFVKKERIFELDRIAERFGGTILDV